MSVKLEVVRKINKIFLSNAPGGKGKAPEVIDHTDVIVRFSDGEIYVAAFFTYEGLLLIRERHQSSGEFLNGAYFWAESLLVIDRCSPENVERVVRHLLDEGDFLSVFRKL